jgi:hypothetical protein
MRRNREAETLRHFPDARAPRGGVGATVALLAMVACLAWDAGYSAGRWGATGVTKVNNSYIEVQR